MGESCVLLLHRDIETQVLRERLESSWRLLSDAEQAGYRNGRLLVSLARIQYALGDRPGSLYFLNAIAREGFTDWTLAVERAREAIEANNMDQLYSAFALGLNDGHVWNGLGTFAKEALRDNTFAIRLYETALKLSPRSAVIHTNIARLCLDNTNDRNSLLKAQRHLDLARQHADFAFRWWKPLREDLNKKLSTDPAVANAYDITAIGESLDRIYAEFLELERSSGPERSRGPQLQELFKRTLDLTYGTKYVRGSLDIDGAESDATFVHGAWVYRAEISWDSRPNGPSEVGELIRRLSRTAQTRGLLVSMSGFTEGALREIKRNSPSYIIHSMDREEFRKVLRGEVLFDSLMQEKELGLFLS